jgi:hypothetical protein
MIQFFHFYNLSLSQAFELEDFIENNLPPPIRVYSFIKYHAQIFAYLELRSSTTPSFPTEPSFAYEVPGT